RLFGLQLARRDQAAVLAGQAYRASAVAVDEVDDLLVDQATEHHFHHVHGFVVGDAHAAHEPCFLAQPREQLANLRAAAVHHHRIEADQFHERDVACKTGLERRVGHRIAAVLDDHGGTTETAD